jgi:alpha-L-fucosidase
LQNTWKKKVKPQVRELLTNYGPIGLIWFDTPRNYQPRAQQELVDLVHSIQPIASYRAVSGTGWAITIRPATTRSASGK